MITITHLGAGRLALDGQVVAMQRYDEDNNMALLKCAEGRSAWIDGGDYLRALMLQPNGLLLTIELACSARDGISAGAADE